MNVRAVVPTQVARRFALNEMFFSVTDAKGRILEGNEIFARVSGYALNELINQPHNIIRHPHMPRAAFAVLWANVRENKPFNGYVLNMAKDGGHYWVFTEAQLTVFDILVRPGPEMSPAERNEVKKVAKTLLERLEDLLVLDWRKRGDARARVKLAIEDTLDSGLPPGYTPELYQGKCAALFEHVYENYYGEGAGTYGDAC